MNTGRKGLKLRIKTSKQRQKSICLLELVWTIGYNLASYKFYKCVSFINTVLKNFSQLKHCIGDDEYCENLVKHQRFFRRFLKGF